MPTEMTRAAYIPSHAELSALFFQKYGPLKKIGWSPKRRFQFRYFLPADVYEAVVNKSVALGDKWMDVGGGNAIFPENPNLAKKLVSRCAKVVAVDPSANIHGNEFAHECVQSTLEDYKPECLFDLATMRMVVEHVENPKEFVATLSRLLRPGGTAIVFTVNRWSPVSVLSKLMPFYLHYPIKQLFWGGHEEDTFPVHYRMNTRTVLRREFESAGFSEKAFLTIDDLSTFSRFKWLSLLELISRRVFETLALSYPETCLLGLYTKQLETQMCSNTKLGKR